MVYFKVCVFVCIHMDFSLFSEGGKLNCLNSCEPWSGIPCPLRQIIKCKEICLSLFKRFPDHPLQPWKRSPKTFYKNIYIFIWLHWVLVTALRIFNIPCSIWDLVLLLGTEPELGAWNVSHWSTREVPCILQLSWAINCWPIWKFMKLFSPIKLYQRVIQN